MRRRFWLILGMVCMVTAAQAKWWSWPFSVQQAKRVHTVMVLMGAPGSGKGTLAQKLHQTTQWPVISASQLIKNQLNANTIQHFQAL